MNTQTTIEELKQTLVAKHDIAFDEMDARLAALGRKRLWLADVTPYSADYLRTVLAPNSSRRTSRVQQILSDAIEREEQRQGTEKTFGAILPERVTLTCTHHERTQWQQAAVPLPMDDWIKNTLNEAAEMRLGLPNVPLKVADEPGETPPSQGNGQSPTNYPKGRRSPRKQA